MLTVSQILAASSDLSGFAAADLKAFFNANCSVEVKKFATRAKMEERVLALATELQADGKGGAVESTSTAVAVVKTDSAEQNADAGEESDDAGEQEETPEEEAARLAAEAHADANPEAQAAKRRDAEARSAQSAGVARSWLDADVRRTRLTRHGVSVAIKGDEETDGEDTEMGTYRSVAEAFRVIGLPFDKHIKFRLALKTSAQKVATFAHDGKQYEFSLDADAGE